MAECGVGAARYRHELQETKRERDAAIKALADHNVPEQTLQKVKLP